MVSLTAIHLSSIIFDMITQSLRYSIDSSSIVSISPVVLSSNSLVESLDFFLSPVPLHHDQLHVLFSLQITRMVQNCCNF